MKYLVLFLALALALVVVTAGLLTDDEPVVDPGAPPGVERPGDDEPPAPGPEATAEELAAYQAELERIRQEAEAERQRLAAEAEAARLLAEEQAAVEAERRAARRAEADRLRKERAAEIFGDVMEPLSEASEAYDRHDELDESSWFGTDQEDNLELINGILDEAMKILDVGQIADTRARLRMLEAEIVELEVELLDLRERRVGAPAAADLGALEQHLKTSREELDAAIAEAQDGIAAREDEIHDLEAEFVEEMRAIGVELDLESARSLLATVSGDDFVEMCVVFDNVRGVTLQLQELTEQSGESLDAAKRYYGSYVVLIRLMDRVQKDFVRRTHEEMIPRLVELSKEAEELIRDAQRNLQSGGDVAINEQNIASNQLTIDATGYYVQYLREQADEIAARNAELEIDLRDAINTYQTVSLSSEVAALMKEGSRNFAALTRLELPPLRGFENAELRAEFERLTERMATGE